MPDIVGASYGQLTVSGFTSGNGRHKAICICSCGNTAEVAPSSLFSGRTTSCGCARIRHGHAVGSNASRTYNSWAMMHDRCRNQNNDSFANYGARGISVCDRWSEFSLFLLDMGGRPYGTSIDRINNAGNYEPSNCKWSSPQEQADNRRVNIMVQWGAERLTLKECCRRAGMSYQNARYRIKRGWKACDAIAGELIAYG